jgi:hypothetical protein
MRKAGAFGSPAAVGAMLAVVAFGAEKHQVVASRKFGTARKAAEKWAVV